MLAFTCAGTLVYMELREIARFGGDVSKFVSPLVAIKLTEKKLT